MIGWSRPVRLPDHPVPGTPLIEARAVTVRLGGKLIISEVDLIARSGEVVALVGPNGAGKSTLLGALSGDADLASGEVLVDGRPMGSWSHVELALRRSVLPQQVTVTFPFTVSEVVRMGRSPWARTPVESSDDEVVAAVARQTDVTDLMSRQYPSLSGGERARVALARVLAQSTSVLLLDEPTAALDVHHQELVLEVARARANEGAAVVVVLHDLGLAVAHADRVAVMDGGRVVADGPPAEVMSPELLSRVYNHEIEVIAHPGTGAPLVLPVRRP